MKLINFLTGTLLALVLVVPVAVHAQGGNLPTVQGLNVAGGTLIGAITRIINVLLTLAAIVAAVYIIIGGVKYITSGGDEDKAGEAKQTILYALIGLIVIGLSAVLANFVITAINAA